MSYFCLLYTSIYIPTDNTAASCTEAINNVASQAKKPIFAGEEGIAKGCGVATLSIIYYDLGYTTGEMAYDILVNGTDIKTCLVYTSLCPVVMYTVNNKQTLVMKGRKNEHI